MDEFLSISVHVSFVGRGSLSTEQLIFYDESFYSYPWQNVTELVTLGNWRKGNLKIQLYLPVCTLTDPVSVIHKDALK